MQVYSSMGSSQVSAADQLAGSAKGATQAKAKGRAVASSPSISRHGTAEFLAPPQPKGKGKVVPNSPASSRQEAAEFPALAEAQGSLGHVSSEASAGRGSPSSSSAMTHQGLYQLKRCACCWCTGEL